MFHGARLLVSWEWRFLTKGQKGTYIHNQAAEMKFFWQKLNIFWCLFKFTDKEGNWRKDIQRVEEDIMKFAVRYSVQEDEWQRGGVGGGQGGSWLGPGKGRKEYGVKWNEKIIIFCGLRKWETRDHVALWHTQTNQMNVTDKQRNCTIQCECSTDSSKLLYTTHIS